MQLCHPAEKESLLSKITYRTTNVDGMKMFYREAGRTDGPALLLLHGFPTSSHMFRNLIPLLADRFHMECQDLQNFDLAQAPKAAWENEPDVHYGS
jgi:hypothetical protein